MKMLDGNTEALRRHQREQDEAEREYMAELPNRITEAHNMSKVALATASAVILDPED